MYFKTFRTCLLTVAAAALLLVGTTHAAPVSGQGTWETTLQARDLDGNGVTDAFYDTLLDITWLRDANVNSYQTWDNAKTWVNNLDFGGYEDWRLPTMLDTANLGCDSIAFSGTDCGYNVQTIDGNIVYSEMAHLYYVTLNNIPSRNTSGESNARGSFNTGDFLNFQVSNYWYDLEYALNSNWAWGLNMNTGAQGAGAKGNTFAAMAVRTGDVDIAEIPEPGTMVLVAAALMGLGAIRRRRAQGA